MEYKNYLKNEDNPRNEDNLKNIDSLTNENDLKDKCFENEDNLRRKIPGPNLYNPSPSRGKTSDLPRRELSMIQENYQLTDNLTLIYSIDPKFPTISPQCRHFSRDRPPLPHFPTTC